MSKRNKKQEKGHNGKGRDHDGEAPAAKPRLTKKTRPRHGLRPDYTPNPERLRNREDRRRQEAAGQWPKGEGWREDLDAMMRRTLETAMLDYQHLIDGIPDTYTVGEDFGDRIEFHHFKVELHRKVGKLFVFGHDGLGIPHAWLTTDRNIKFLPDERGHVQKTMLEFLRRALDIKVEEEQMMEERTEEQEPSSDPFARAAGAFGATVPKTPALEQPAVRLVTDNGKQVAPATVVAELIGTTPISKFVPGESIGRYHMRHGLCGMQILQIVRGGKHVVEVESIDPKHCLAKVGVVPKMQVSSALLWNSMAFGALRGNAHLGNTSAKIALVEFIQKKLDERDERKSTSTGEDRKTA